MTDQPIACAECGDKPSPDGLACGNCGLYQSYPTQPAPETSTFTIPVELPYDVPSPDCCPAFRVRIDVVPDEQYTDIPDYTATFTHRTTCSFWSYI